MQENLEQKPLKAKKRTIRSKKKLQELPMIHCGVWPYSRESV